MVRYFIIIKRKNSNKYLGAIPARPGISLNVLRISAQKQIKPGFNYKIVTESQLKKILPKIIKKPNKGGIKMPMRRKTMSRSRKTKSKRTMRKTPRKKYKKRS